MTICGYTIAEGVAYRADTLCVLTILAILAILAVRDAAHIS
jgi:hypothetical protein